MGHTRPLQDMLYAEMKGRIMETDSSVPEKRGAYFYYTSNRGRENNIPSFAAKKIRSIRSRGNFARSKLTRRVGKPFCSVGAFTVSPDDTKLAYSVDVEGTEVYTVYIKDLTNSSFIRKRSEIPLAVFTTIPVWSGPTTAGPSFI